MDNVNLPIEKANVPTEEARQPIENEKRCVSVDGDEITGHKNKKDIAYKDVLSQPPKSLTHKQRMLWLQQRRTEGLWAQCDDCSRWRYLPRVLDQHELPAKWYCWMNPDKSLATCTAPEVPICLYDEDDLIHAEYAAGSIVLARLPGFPWWPAMVCDCPDTEQYYWLDGFSDIPTHYNVVFFDAPEVSRAWMSPEQLMPYKNNMKFLKKSSKTRIYKSRLDIAITQANDAEKLKLTDRLAKYSFLAKFNGKILTPKKVKKRQIVKYRNMLKRKFNIVDFSDESSSDEDNIIIEKNKPKALNKKAKKQKKISKIVITNEYSTQSHEIDNRESIYTAGENLNNTKDLNSLVVQMDSNSDLIKSTNNETTEASNNTKEQEINTIGQTFITQSLNSQDATNMEVTIDEDSDKSDNFEF